MKTCSIKELERNGFSKKEILALGLVEKCIREDWNYYYGKDFPEKKAKLQAGLIEKGLQQSFLAKKDKYTLEEATARVKEMGGKIKKIDDGKNFWRFRQFSPKKCDPDSYGTWVGPEKLGVSVIYCNLK